MVVVILIWRIIWLAKYTCTCITIDCCNLKLNRYCLTLLKTLQETSTSLFARFALSGELSDNFLPKHLCPFIWNWVYKKKKKFHSAVQRQAFTVKKLLVIVYQFFFLYSVSKLATGLELLHDSHSIVAFITWCCSCKINDGNFSKTLRERERDLITRIKTGRNMLQVPILPITMLTTFCVYLHHPGYHTFGQNAVWMWGVCFSRVRVCVFSAGCCVMCFFPADTIVVLGELFVQSPQGLSGAYLC